MIRRLISSGSRLELEIGFSRAVRCGTNVAISGTAPIAPDGAATIGKDVYEQTRRCLDIIEQALSGTVTVWLGSALIGIVTGILDSQHPGSRLWSSYWQLAGQGCSVFANGKRSKSLLFQIVYAKPPVLYPPDAIG